MKIEIDVSDEKSQEIIQKGLEAFDKDELHNLIREIIIEKMRTDESIDALFYTKEKKRYENGVIVNAGPLLRQAASSIDVSPALKEVEELMTKELRENYKEITEKVMLNIFLSALTKDSFTGINALRNELTSQLNNLRRNNNLK